jgi:hypothetical protein
MSDDIPPRRADDWSFVVDRPAAVPVWGGPVPPPPRSGGPGTSRALTVAAVTVVLVLLVLAFAILRTVNARAQRLSLATDLQSGPVIGAPGETYSYAWINHDGSPVRWNPCAPVHWVVNPTGAPTGAIEDLTAAMGQVSAASGIAFVRDGDVTEEPSPSRPAVIPRRYGDGWAPVLISWGELQGSALGAGLSVTGDTVGVATPVAISRPRGGGVLVTGQIVFERELVVSPGFATTRSQGAVMLHELSHILGLGHTNDNAQLLYEGGEPIAGIGELGPGDRAGLASVGRAAGCLDTPSPSDLD